MVKLLLTQVLAAVQLFFVFSPTTRSYWQLMILGTGLEQRRSVLVLQVTCLYCLSFDWNYETFLAHHPLHVAFQLPVHASCSQKLRPALSHGVQFLKVQLENSQVHGGSEIVAARKITFSGYPGVIYRSPQNISKCDKAEKKKNTFKLPEQNSSLNFWSDRTFAVVTTSLWQQLDWRWFDKNDAIIRPILFSICISYPFSRNSKDKSGFKVIETTIGNSNPDLWRFLTPQSVLEVENYFLNLFSRWEIIFPLDVSWNYCAAP